MRLNENAGHASSSIRRALLYLMRKGRKSSKIFSQVLLVTTPYMSVNSKLHCTLIIFQISGRIKTKIVGDDTEAP